MYPRPRQYRCHPQKNACVDSSKKKQPCFLLSNPIHRSVLILFSCMRNKHSARPSCCIRVSHLLSGGKNKHSNERIEHVFCLLRASFSLRTTTPARLATETNKPEQICVLGGGFGGLYAALRLQKMPWRGRRPVVTLIDKGDKFTFLPLLYEFASESAWRESGRESAPQTKRRI